MLVLLSLLGCAPTHAIGLPEADPPEAGQEVRLLDRGMGLHRPLRWHPQSGAKVRLQQTSQVRLFREVLGEEIPDTTPAVHHTDLRLTVRDAGPEAVTVAGQLIDVSTGEDAGLPAELRHELAARLQERMVMTTLYRYTPRGELLASWTEDDPGSPEQIPPTMPLWPVFPEEAVGAGASWEVLAQADAPDGEGLLRQTWTLTAIDGERLTLAVGWEGRQEDSVATGAGQVVFDLGGPAPISAEHTLELVMDGQPRRAVLTHTTRQLAPGG